MKVLPVEQPRVFGIETEYGLHPFGPNEIIPPERFRRAQPDYLHSSDFGISEYGRIYVDQTRNIEVCTPELLTPEGLLASHFGGERHAAYIAERLYGDTKQIQKRTLDSEMHSRGDHENFMVGWAFKEPQQRLLCTHLATRIVLTGAGLVYTDSRGVTRYAIDQRPFVMGGKSIANGSTEAGRKPFMKTLTKGKSMDDTKLTQRLQVVCGSQNTFPFPVLARVFNTSGVIRLIEHGKFPAGVQLARPMAAIRQVVGDPSLRTKVRLTDGRSMTAVEIQLSLLEAFLALDDIPRAERTLGNLSVSILDDLRGGYREPWEGHVEWLGKFSVGQRHATARGYDFMSDHGKQFDIRWHENPGRQARPESPDGPAVTDSLAAKLRRHGRVALFPEEERLEQGMRMAPDPTRGKLRAEAIAAAAAKNQRMLRAYWHRWQAPDDKNPTVVYDARRTTLRPKRTATGNALIKAAAA